MTRPISLRACILSAIDSSDKRPADAEIRRHRCGMAAAFVVAFLQCAVATAADAKRQSPGPRSTELRDAVGLRVEGDCDASRTKLFEMIGHNKDFAPVHWHLGELQIGNSWVKYDRIIELADVQAAIAEYSRLRGNEALSIERHRELADWCRDHNLADRERLHLVGILQQQPGDRDAHLRLGDVLRHDRWINLAAAAAWQAAARHREQEALRSMTAWSQIMKQTASWLPKQESAARRQAIEKFEQIVDPAAIPAMRDVLFPAGAEAAELCINRWGAMKSPDASLALAQTALFASNEKLAQKAAAQLRGKPEDFYVPLLLSALVSPVEHRYQYFETPDGQLVAKHVLTREFEDHKFEIERRATYQDAGGNLQHRISPVEREARDSKKVFTAVAAENKSTEQLNNRIYAAVAAGTGEDVPHDPAETWNWWNDRNEVYVSGEKPIYYQHRTSTVTLNQVRKYDCLAGGTPIWTDRGALPVEKIEPGDRVLSQDPATGELAYKLVYRTTVRPPERLVEIKTASGSLIASGGHPFWVIGKGWIRARQLSPGDRLFGVDDETAVTAVSDSDSLQPSYNLLVANFHTYFAGETRVLSHDNTVRQPISAPIPGVAEQ